MSLKSFFGSWKAKKREHDEYFSATPERVKYWEVCLAYEIAEAKQHFAWWCLGVAIFVALAVYGKFSV